MNKYELGQFINNEPSNDTLEEQENLNDRMEIPEQNSHIERNRGLEEFRIYRVADTHRLLRLAMSEIGKTNFLGRALFFTTQKNLAYEFATDPENRNLLFEQRGIDFKTDLENLGAGVKIILISHNDLPIYSSFLHKDGTVKPLEGKILEDYKNFLENRTYPASQIPLRSLRSAAEIIVILPENINKLPLHTRARVQKVTPLKDRAYKRTGKYDVYPSGGFYEAAKITANKPNKRLKNLQSPSSNKTKKSKKKRMGRKIYKPWSD